MASGKFAEDRDDPFANVREDMDLKMGLYGMQVDSQLESLRKIKEAKEFSKAVKADDAKIPVYLWNDRIRSPGILKDRRDTALAGFRKLGQRVFMQGLGRGCLRHMQRSYGSQWARLPWSKDGEPTNMGRDREAMVSLLWHSARTDWFEYHSGSRLIYTHFPLRYRQMARDGVPIWFEWAGPTTREPQPVISDPVLHAKAKEKIIKVIRRRYLVMTDLNIKLLIKYFAVPKGDDDVRLVYDATANRLNECVWSPSFWLPTIDSLVRAVDQDLWMTDRDVGDMFLNFQLHGTARPFTGVDLSLLYESDEDVGPQVSGLCHSYVSCNDSLSQGFSSHH